MKRTFRETPTFSQKVESIDGPELLKAIQDSILENPSVGSTIAGTEGLKKFRMADPSRRKG